MTWVSLILAALKAVPYFDEWFKKLAIAYADWKMSQKDKAFTRGMIELAQKHDQRLLEEAAGLPQAGKPAEDQSEVGTRPRRKR